MLFLGVWFFLRWYKSRLLGFEAERSQYTRPSVGLIGLANGRWGRLFYGIFFFSNLASAIPAVLVLFYVRDRLAAEQYTGLFLVIYFLSGAAGLPVWQRLSVHTGKARAWAISMMLAIATFLWAFTLAEGDIVPFAIICCLSGAALGADLAIPPAMVADRIDSIRDHHNAPNISPLTHYALSLRLPWQLGSHCQPWISGVSARSTNGRRGRSIFGYGICFVSLLH